MKKLCVRVLSLSLALLCLFSGAAVFASAEGAAKEETEYAALPALWTAMEEGKDSAEGVRSFVRIPYVGTYTPATGSTEAVMTGNCNRFLQVKHAAMSEQGAYIIEASYRPHTNRAGTAVAEVLFDRFSVTTASGGRQEDAGRDLVLCKINLNDGSLDLGVGSKLIAGASGMTLDKWNTLRIVFYNANAHYEVYVNGSLYGYQYNPKLAVEKNGREQSYFNCKDISIEADRFIPLRCARLSAYTKSDLGEGTSYVDVRGVSIEKTQDFSVILDGKERRVAKDIGLSLTDGTKTLLYAEVKNPNKPIFYTSDPVLKDLEEGAVIHTRYLEMKTVENVHSMRTEAPYGLRFLTAVNKADYEQLEKDPFIKRIGFGTVIFSMEKMSENTLTESLLEKMKHTDSAWKSEGWYDAHEISRFHLFAGELVNIAESDYNTRFAGVGYVKLLMRDGSTVTAFANTKKENIPTKTLAMVAHEEMMRNPDMDENVYKIFEKYAANVATDLHGLNVLAIGDSLFQGARNNDGEFQWINMMGRQYDWNLTNLGIGGASISYQPDKDIANVSIYDLLFNHPEEYCYGCDRSVNKFYYTVGKPSGVKSDVDIILLQAGSNDYGPKVGAPMGTIDSTDHNTFLGAWKLVIERLLVEYPNATVVMMTAWENGNQNREDKANAIEYTSSVVDLYEALYKTHERVRLIDSGDPEVSGVNMLDPEFKSTYSFDSFHLNDEGMLLMANSMLPYLEKIATERRLLREQAGNGLDVLAIGDSLFGGHSLADGEQWLEILAERCQWNLTNLGVNGWTVAYNPGAYADPSAVRTSMYNKLMTDPNFKFGSTSSGYYSYGTPSGNPGDVDLIFLEGGWNDFGHGLPLGEATDTDGSTYMGAINSMVEKLLDTYPNARVVLITSWHKSDVRSKDGANRMDFVANGMKAVYQTNYADNSRVYIIDAGDPAVSGIRMSDSEWAKEHAMDAAHLNAKGMQVMADSMYDLIVDEVLKK